MNPKGKKPMPTVPEEWVSHAESDLAIARLGDGKPGVLASADLFSCPAGSREGIKGCFTFS